jgi:DNA-binding beta-propeller fold protein YncE
VLLRVFVLIASVLLLISTSISDASPASSTRGLLVVANQYEHTVLIVDPEKRQQLAKITVGVNGHELIVSPDGANWPPRLTSANRYALIAPNLDPTACCM